PPGPPLFPYTTLFRSEVLADALPACVAVLGLLQRHQWRDQRWAARVRRHGRCLLRSLAADQLQLVLQLPSDDRPEARDRPIVVEIGRAHGCSPVTIRP